MSADSSGTDGYFGLCPVCHQTDGYINSGMTGAVHVFLCHAHKVAWAIGMNMFSSWRDETPESLVRNRALLETYEGVDPWYPPESGPRPGIVSRPALRLLQGGRSA